MSAYRPELYSSCVGGVIDESYAAGLYDLIPEEEMFLEKGFYRYTVTYESTSSDNFCWPHTYNGYYNAIDADAINFEEGTVTATGEFWLKVDLNVALNDLENFNTAAYLGGAEYSLVEASYVAATEIFEPRSYDGVVVEDYEKQGSNIVVTVTSGETDGYMLLPLFNYKGYQVTSDDKMITNQNLVMGEGKVIRIDIPAGYSGTLRISFHGFWYWKLANFVSIVTLVFLLWIVRRRRQLKK